MDFRAIARLTKLHMKGGGRIIQNYIKSFRLIYSNDTRWWSEYSHSNDQLDTQVRIRQANLFQAEFRQRSYSTNIALLVINNDSVTLKKYERN